MPALTPLQIAAQVYNDAGLDQTLISFSMTERPYNAALSLINDSISDMNRAGEYWFTESIQSLTYSPGVYTYNLSSTFTNDPIEPRRIIRVRRELANQQGNLTSINFNRMQDGYYRPIATQKPIAWSNFGQTLYLNSIPDKDYQIKLYFYDNIQQVVVGTNDTTATLLPNDHVDVLKNLLKAYLFKEMGRADFSPQFSLAQQKLSKLVGASNRNTSRPTQMPGAF